MDISTLNSRSGSDTPTPLHLRHPATGDLLWDRQPSGQPGDPDYEPGKPVLVWLYGAESDSVQTAQKAIRERRLTGKDTGKRSGSRGSKVKVDDRDDRSVAEFHRDTAEAAIPLISHFENIERDGKPLSSSDDDKTWFLNLQVMNLRNDTGEMSFLEQVLDHASTRGNYLGNAKPS